MFPEGYKETFLSGHSGPFDPFVDLGDAVGDIAIHIGTGDFDSLADPEIWLRLAAAALNADGVLRDLGFNAIHDAIGFDPEEMVLDAAGDVIGVDLAGYRYSNAEILQFMVDQSGLVDPDGWGPVRWNDRMTHVYFDGVEGACDGAWVRLWERTANDDRYNGSIYITPDMDPSLALEAHHWDDEVSMYQVNFAPLPPPPPIPRPSTFETLGQSTLPTGFAIEADVTINWSNPWNNIITIGDPEYGNQAAFRLQAGEEGQWYIAIGDGADFNGEYFGGHWKFGTPFKLQVTYDHHSTHTSVYENGERVLTYSPVPVPSGMTGTVILGSEGAGSSFNAQVSGFQIIPPSTFETLGPSTLPTDFAIEADVTINTSDPWNNIITIGDSEYGNQAAFRLQAGEEGQWYIAIGDGADFNGEYFPGNWTFGMPFKLQVTYDHYSTHTSVYENGERVFTFSPVPVPSGMTGTVVLGSDGAGPNFNAQVSGFQFMPLSTFQTLGPSTLPIDFAIEADVTINWSDPWNNIITIGDPEYNNQAAFRLQAGEEGQWYIAIGDGADFNFEYFEGHWEFGTPFSSMFLV